MVHIINIILDFKLNLDKTTDFKPTFDEVLNEAYTKNYYSFVVSTNTLYLGRSVLKNGVSTRLPTRSIVSYTESQKRSLKKKNRM